jgi:DNA-binding CsgD family transcriptional regulator
MGVRLTGGLRHTEQSKLLERATELERIDGAIEAAVDGNGGVVLVEGRAGIGKTRLLASAIEVAADRDLQVLSGRGRELERGFGFGVVRQLFERRLRTARKPERNALLAGAAGLISSLVLPDATPPADAPQESQFQVLHGLYWLLANVTQAGPTLVVVDDAHWADPASLRYLAFAAPRVPELGVVMLVSCRGDSGEDPLLKQLAADPGTDLLHPQPLSGDAVGAMLRGRLGDEVDPDFAAACQSITAGNPFLLEELVDELQRDEIEPTAESALRVTALGPKAVTRTILGELARLPAEVAPLARAVAILERATVQNASRLAELSDDDGRRAAGDLVAASLLDSGPLLEFRHPIVRNSIYEDIPQPVRAELHARAAKLLAGQPGTPPEAAAAHLLACEPAADPSAVALLRRAAERAQSRGSPETAASYLRRAVEEPPDRADLAAILLELSAAEAVMGDAAGVRHLEEALPLLQEPKQRVEAARTLALLLAFQDQCPDALAVLDEQLAEIGEERDEERVAVECDFVCFASIGSGLRGRVRPQVRRLRGIAERGWGEGTPVGRRLAARAALDSVLDNEPFERSIALADRALADGRFLAEEPVESAHFPAIVFSLIFTDSLDRAEQLLTEALQDTQRRGSDIGCSHTATYRAMSAFRRGDLAKAEEDALTGLTAAASPVNEPFRVAGMLHVLIERGELEAGERLLERTGLTEASGTSFGFIPLLEARGHLRLAQGRAEDALVDLLEAGRIQDGSEILNPSIVAWRSSAALALQALGRDEEAIEMARAEAELARVNGVPRALGMALRRQGVVQGGSEGERLLVESVDVLRPSVARLEYARSLAELGAARRRANQRVEAREHLRPALETAEECGAAPLAERAREELMATGARPRRAVLTGVDSLTASERRVARMAAAGLSNPEIAQRLFVTRKTVEFHLSQAYRKLDVSSRKELPGVLTG